VLPTSVNAEGRQSSCSKTAAAATMPITKHSSSPVSKPEASQQRINSRDIGMKTDVRVNSGSVKVLAPSLQCVYPYSVSPYTKSDSSKKLQASKQGTSAYNSGYIVTRLAVMLP